MPMHRRDLLRTAGLVAAGGAVTSACGRVQHRAAAASELVVTDQRGVRVTLNQPARRIVAIVFPAAAMLMAVDSGPEHIVGVHDAAAAAIKQGILGEIFPKAKRIPSGVADQDFTPNVESVVALDPDVVVQWGDRGSGITAPLQDAGLNVVGLKYGTQSDLEAWLGIFGTMLGKRRRAQQMVEAMHAALADIRRSAPKTGGRPKVLYFNHLQGGLQVGGKATYNDFYIKLVGGINPAERVNGLGMVDTEQVIAWDPDIILLGNFDDTVPKDIFDRADWKGLSAVRSRRVYKVPLGGYRWDPPNQESILMWRWLSMIAHPNATKFDLRGQLVKEYLFLYNYHPSSSQIDKILWSGPNAGSAGYRRFNAR